MILFEEAYEKVISVDGIKLDTVEVDLLNSTGRILAEDAIADVDMPPFNKSAMDGYACRREDIENELTVIEVIPAGKIPEKVIGKNQCSKIMTGAMLPEGADTVIIVEEVEEIGSDKVKFTGNFYRPNFVKKAEDVKVGDILLKKGLLIKPQHIAILASIGYAKIKVYRKVQVAIISTGNELVEPNQKPDLSQIRNSNAYQLFAQVQRLGAEPTYFGIAEDTKESTEKILKRAFDNCDLVLLTGGVSMGDYDYVPIVLKEMGVEEIFHSVAIQPGKPTMFGRRKHQFCFGLPGNPVSSYTIFELFAKPLIYKLMGFEYKPLKLSLPIGVDYRRKRAERMSWIPIIINENGEIMPIDYHGSAHIHALHIADGLIGIPIGKKEVLKGEKFDVRQI